MWRKKNIETRTELKPKYAYARCRGIFDAGVMLEVYECAFQFAVSESRKAVLVDMRDVTGEPFTVMERFDAGQRIAELQRGVGRGVVFAILGNEPMIDPNRFAETVGRNRGAIGRIFTDFGEAVAWLERPS